ncbi:MAG: tetratricopeptide repeat protein [Blastocatellia bacterium]|nr:tetratricopeptide repeat protein [Blastocatellia bacterium]
MIFENTLLLLKLYLRPIAGMSDIMDRGRLLFFLGFVVVLSALWQLGIASRIYQNFEKVPYTVTLPAQMDMDDEAAPQAAPAASYPQTRTFYRREPLPLVGQVGWWFVSFKPFSIFATFAVLGLLYVPGIILIMTFTEHLGSFDVILRRDYGPLLACTLSSWAASHLPFALLGLLLDVICRSAAGVLSPPMQALTGMVFDPVKLAAALAFVLWMAATLYFGILMIFTLRTVFGTTWGKALVVISCAWMSMIFEGVILMLASPFILYWAYVYFRGDITDIDSAFRTRQSLHHNLVAATVNPHDAEAHYQLGLIYQQRRQYTEAINRFKRAIEIDPREIDAHFQLGRIAREQGRLQEAISHFDAVVSLDDKHCRHEIWREIGATYLAAGMTADALTALERYTGRREYDPEGLCLFGETLAKLGQKERARQVFEHCIEAVRTMPYYRRGQVRRWSKLSKEHLGKL